jgi:hypothetical protein
MKTQNRSVTLFLFQEPKPKSQNPKLGDNPIPEIATAGRSSPPNLHKIPPNTGTFFKLLTPKPKMPNPNRNPSPFSQTRGQPFFLFANPKPKTRKVPNPKPERNPAPEILHNPTVWIRLLRNQPG